MYNFKMINKYILFKSRGFLSPWYPTGFIVEGETYSSVEQFMMAQKAKLFKDKKSLSKIMAISSPSEIKKQGRKVTPFDSVKWEKIKDQVVFEANLAKFSQNPLLKKKLLKTYPAVLVEFGEDTYWGTGLTKNQIKKTNREDWPGKNRQGEIIMSVREKLKQALSYGVAE